MIKLKFALIIGLKICPILGLFFTNNVNLTTTETEVLPGGSVTLTCVAATVNDLQWTGPTGLITTYQSNCFQLSESNAPNINHLTIQCAPSGSSDMTSTLTISNFDPARDSGDWKCQGDVGMDSVTLTSPDTGISGINIFTPFGFITSLNELYHVDGENDVLTCSATCNGTCQYEWKKGSQVVASTSQINVDGLSQGLYTCHASYGGTTLRKDIQIITLGSNFIEITPVVEGVVSITEGDNVNITCSSTGVYCSTMSSFMCSNHFDWMHGSIHTNPPLGETWPITNASKQMAGTFRCIHVEDEQQSNTHFETFKAFALEIKHAPSSISITPTTNPVTIATGNSLTLSCTVECTPSCSYQWTYNGVVVASVATYSINAVTSGQSGDYTCTATNSLGVLSATTALSVGAPPSSAYISNTIEGIYSVRPDRPVHLRCSADCSPACTYTWSRESDGQVVSTTRDLNTTSYFSPQIQYYRCNATNAFGTTSTRLFLEVLQNEFRNPTNFSLTSTNTSPTPGDTVSFTCSVESNPVTPTAEMDWYGPHGQVAVFISCHRLYQLDGINASYYSINCSASPDGKTIVSTLTINDFDPERDGGTWRCLDDSVLNRGPSINVSEPDAPSSISITPAANPVTIATGNSLTLSCTAECQPSCSYQWTYNGVVVASVATYSINAVTSGQSGDYTCTATNSLGVLTATTTLSVGAPPSSAYISNTIEGIYSVRPDRPVHLRCSADCSPACTYTWSRESDGQVVSTTRDLNTTSYFSPQIQYYICNATNAFGTTSTWLFLEVLQNEFRNPTNFSLTTTNTSPTPGDTVSLTCSVESNPVTPTAEMDWYGPHGQVAVFISCHRLVQLDGINASYYSINCSASPDGKTIVSTLTINDFDPERDGGTWRCLDDSVLNRGPSINVSQPDPYAPVTVSISPATPVVMYGRSITLECSAQCQPACSYSWTFGSLSVSTERNLTISDNQAGTYTCTATNSVGSLSNSTDLTVWGSASTGPVNFTLVASSQLVSPDTSVTLTCYGFGNQELDWHGPSGVYIVQAGCFRITEAEQNDNSYLGVGCGQSGGWTTSSLTIHRFDPGRDSGTWSCSDDSSLGSGVSGSVTLSATANSIGRVTIAASKSRIADGSLTILEGEDDILTCSANCDGACQYRWMKDSQTVAETNTLNLTKITTEMGGRYFCNVSNHEMHISKDFNVRVRNRGVLSFSPNVDEYNVTEGSSISVICQHELNSCTHANGIVCHTSWSYPSANPLILNIENLTRSLPTEFVCTYTEDDTTANYHSELFRTLRVNVIDTGIAFHNVQPLNGFLVNSNTLHRVQGETDVLTCSAVCDGACQYYWLKGSQVVSNTKELNVNDSTSGDYTCRASNNGVISTKRVSISVAMNENSVTISPSQDGVVVVNEGDNVNITCSASGQFCSFGGSVVCTNHFESMPGLSLVSPPQSDIWTINAATRNMTGMFRCIHVEGEVFDNPFATPATLVKTYKSFKLEVRYGPREVTIIPDSNPVTIAIGGSVNLVCSADCRPDCTYTWKYSDVTVSSVATYGIDSVTVDNSGVYTCTASNSMGSTSGSTEVKYTSIITDVSIQTSSSSSSIPEGQSVTLTCNAACVPVDSCSYTWWRSGQTTPLSTTRELGLTSIERSRSGEYVCEARNDMRRNASIDITVQYPPTASSLTISRTPEKEIYMTGTSLTLYCSATCVPTCTYQWLKGTETLSTSNNGMLSLRSLTINNEAQYTCIASNGMSDPVSKSTFISILLDLSNPGGGNGSLPSALPIIQLLVLCSVFVTYLTQR